MCISKCSGYSCTLRGFVSRIFDEPFIINVIYFYSGLETLAEEKRITTERFGRVIYICVCVCVSLCMSCIENRICLDIQRACSNKIINIGDQ